jgi:hypothetical protein
MNSFFSSGFLIYLESLIIPAKIGDYVLIDISTNSYTNSLISFSDIFYDD